VEVPREIIDYILRHPSIIHFEAFLGSDPFSGVMPFASQLAYLTLRDFGLHSSLSCSAPFTNLQNLTIDATYDDFSLEDFEQLAQICRTTYGSHKPSSGYFPTLTIVDSSWRMKKAPWRASALLVDCEQTMTWRTQSGKWALGL
jgi:hypothetical protein